MLSTLRSLKSFFVPRHCDICQGPLLDSENTICSKCYTMVKASAQQNDSESVAAKLFWGIAPIQRAGVLFDYQSDTPISEILVDIKYRGYADVCLRMGRALASFYQPRHFFEGIDLIIPVPLSEHRLHKRGYNQSEKIALGISEFTGLPLDVTCIKRIVDNETQTHLLQTERMKNVENIFALTHPERLKGKHILIVDDVITTGATISSIIRTITKAAPDTTFSVLALGRGTTGKPTQT